MEKCENREAEADRNRVQIYGRARSSYRACGLTLSGNKNGDTLQLREAPSATAPTALPDFQGRERSFSLRVQPVRRVVWGSPQDWQGTRSRDEPCEVLALRLDASCNPALSNQWGPFFARPLWKGQRPLMENCPSASVRVTPDTVPSTQLLWV